MIDFSNLIPFYESQLNSQGVLGAVLQIIISISPILLAIILFIIFWPLWVNYVRSAWLFSLKYATLEIRLPKDILKSPRAMELVLNALHNTSDGSKFAQYWKGEKRPTYSLELASVEGVVRFYIYTEDRRKQGVMSALYSQFPGIEVTEVEDYARPFHFDPEETKLWGAEFLLTKNSVYPLRTYVDYGLDKDPKEELKVDPMVPMLEFLANLGANQQIWFQFIIRAHIKDQVKPGSWFKLNDNFKDAAQKEINKIMGRDPKTRLRVPAKEGDKPTEVQLISLSEGEKNMISAIDRKVSKLLFDVGIRTIYIARKDLYDKPNGIGGVISSFKHFNYEDMNGLKPNGDKWSPKLVGAPWEDYKGIRATNISNEVLGMYKRRSHFYAPRSASDKEVLVLNSEELATMYHLPGQVAFNPNIPRVPSKKSEPPSNLPI
jgi:hypothetical protein